MEEFDEKITPLSEEDLESVSGGRKRHRAPVVLCPYCGERHEVVRYISNTVHVDEKGNRTVKREFLCERTHQVFWAVDPGY